MGYETWLSVDGKPPTLYQVGGAEQHLVGDYVRPHGGRLIRIVSRLWTERQRRATNNDMMVSRENPRGYIIGQGVFVLYAVSANDAEVRNFPPIPPDEKWD